MDPFNYAGLYYPNISNSFDENSSHLTSPEYKSRLTGKSLQSAHLVAVDTLKFAAGIEEVFTPLPLQTRSGGFFL